LIELRGGLEPFWAGYLDEMIEMIDTSWEMIHVVGHLDLPKLYAPLPEAMKDVEHSSHFLARRMRTLLEMISDLNLALDVNLSGLRKGCGLYPDMEFLKRAKQLQIPIAIGSDSHQIEEIGRDYTQGIELARSAGYRHYVTFSRGITEKRPLFAEEDGHFKILNLGVEILKLRFEPRLRQKTPRFSFGGSFRGLLKVFDGSVSMGEYDAIRVRRDDRSITLSDSSEEAYSDVTGRGDLNCLYCSTPWPRKQSTWKPPSCTPCPTALLRLISPSADRRSASGKPWTSLWAPPPTASLPSRLTPR
jgi:histidinol-phosphatase (PHP family)